MEKDLDGVCQVIEDIQKTINKEFEFNSVEEIEDLQEELQKLVNKLGEEITDFCNC